MIDRHVILAVVLLIGGTLFLLAGGIIYAGIRGATVDAGVTALAGSALGYLGGILTNVSRRPETPAAPPPPALPEPPTP